MGIRITSMRIQIQLSKTMRIHAAASKVWKVIFVIFIASRSSLWEGLKIFPSTRSGELLNEFPKISARIFTLAWRGLLFSPRY